MDRRRVLLGGLVFALIAVVLLVLGRRAAAHAGNALPHASLERALLVVLVAGGCGAWGETMRQLAAIARAGTSED
jgi:H+/gluconate symporter-like permease